MNPTTPAKPSGKKVFINLAIAVLIASGIFCALFYLPKGGPDKKPAAEKQDSTYFDQKGNPQVTPVSKDTATVVSNGFWVKSDTVLFTPREKPKAAPAKKKKAAVKPAVDKDPADPANKKSNDVIPNF